MRAFQNELENSVQNSLNSIQKDYVTINSTMPFLDAKLLELEEKIRRARELLVKLEQPVKYELSTNEALPNPDEKIALKYTEISLDFKYSTSAQGVLFFAENNVTSEKVLLHMSNSVLVFEFTNLDAQTVTITSPVLLCPNCWFRVYASR